MKDLIKIVTLILQEREEYKKKLNEEYRKIKKVWVYNDFS